MSLPALSGGILPDLHTVLASAFAGISDPGVFKPARGPQMPRNEFFTKMARAMVEPFVDRDLGLLQETLLPFLLAAGFTVAGAPAFQRKMGASLAIRDARVLLVDPASSGTEPTLSVTTRLVTRCDLHFSDSPDLMLDVVARRLGRDDKAQRPFLKVTFASLRADWSNLGGQSFTEALSIGMTLARGTGEADGSFATSAREFSTQLIDQLAP